MVDLFKEVRERYKKAPVNIKIRKPKHFLGLYWIDVSKSGITFQELETAFTLKGAIKTGYRRARLLDENEENYRVTVDGSVLTVP